MQSAQELERFPNPDFLHQSGLPYSNGHWVRIKVDRAIFPNFEAIAEALEELGVYFHLGPRTEDNTITRIHANVFFGPDYNRATGVFKRASGELKERVFRLYEPLLESIEIPWDEVRDCSKGAEFIRKKKFRNIKRETGEPFNELAHRVEYTGNDNADYWKEQEHGNYCPSDFSASDIEFRASAPGGSGGMGRS